MRSFFLFSFAVICFCACQREPEFIEPNPNRTDSTGSTSPIKAIVFDGSLAPIMPFLNYDSLVFSINNLDATVTHYAKNGAVMWREFLNYDNNGRVTKYIVDFIPNVNYRHTWYTYTGVDSFPAGITDSLNDSDLIIMNFNRTATQTSSSGTDLTYSRNYSVPGTGYGESYNVKFAFATSGQLRSAVSEGFATDIQEHHIYNAAGLLDSTYTSTITLSSADSTRLKIMYSPNNNPLAVLGKALFKNLYSFHPFIMGRYSFHFVQWTEPAAFFAPRLPLSAKQYDYNNAVDVSFNYNFQLQGTALKLATIQSFNASASPTTTTTNVRFY